MAHLLIRKGDNAGQRVTLDKDTFVLGRSPECDLPVPFPSVSRQHARLVRLADVWYIEDMKSRNKTFVNNQAITARVALKRNDRIRICEFEAVFSDAAAPSPAYQVTPAIQEPEEERVESSSTITSLATHGSKVLEIQPMENLRVILALGNRLSTTLELDQLLPKIADSFFDQFSQADRCFVVLRDESGEDLTQAATRTRRQEDEPGARFSRTVILRCFENVQAFLSEDVLNDKRLPGNSFTTAPVRSIMCAPLCTTDQRIYGAVQLDTLGQAKKFSAADLRLLVGLAAQAAIALQNASLYQEMQKREQIERDLELAAQVQRSILPDGKPEFPGYQFFTHYASALEVGGDYFDFIPVPRDRLALTLGDVAGKSVPAAILMAKLSSDVRSCLLTETDPAEAICRLNNMLYRNLSRTDRLVTFIAALLDATTRIVTLVNAGHCPPILYRRATDSLHDAMPHELSGVPLGVVEQPNYKSWQVELRPGDTLVFYTDGVSDALNAQNQQFKVQGIHTTLTGGGPYTPASLGSRLVKAVQQHASGRSQYDDITLVCLGRSE
jgi:serine phosphatase RsbU (regulator of sigma subunit)/pSer/pThr/pTyr-binding forkhead associated (FHA) protein